MSRSVHRVNLAPGFVLHQRPFRDSSLIVELFTAEFGRLTSFARAARGPRSRFLGLQPFRPLLLSWSGRGEAPSLTAAEPDGAMPAPLAAPCLMSAFYLNELLLKLTGVHDPQPALYAQYAATLQQLRVGVAVGTVLRQFEKRLLELLGFGLELERECGTHQPVVADSYYHFAPGVGVSAASHPADSGRRGGSGSGGGGAGAVLGRWLLLLAADQEPLEPEGQRAVREVLRAALDHCLDGRELKTRTVARAVARMERCG